MPIHSTKALFFKYAAAALITDIDATSCRTRNIPTFPPDTAPQLTPDLVYDLSCDHGSFSGPRGLRLHRLCSAGWRGLCKLHVTVRFDDSVPNVIPQGFLYLIWSCIYNLWFHPLAKYPGPFLAKISPVSLPMRRSSPFIGTQSADNPQVYSIWGLFRGRWPFDVHELHLKYGMGSINPVTRAAKRRGVSMLTRI